MSRTHIGFTDEEGACFPCTRCGKKYPWPIGEICPKAPPSLDEIKTLLFAASTDEDPSAAVLELRAMFEPESDDPTKGEQTMSYVDGKCWRCECGSNVQTKMGGGKLRCNGCGDMYIGVPVEKSA
jgi:hypothetical protein